MSPTQVFYTVFVDGESSGPFTTRAIAERFAVGLAASGRCSNARIVENLYDAAHGDTIARGEFISEREATAAFARVAQPEEAA
jgi:hypothetical protein